MSVEKRRRSAAPSSASVAAARCEGGAAARAPKADSRRATRERAAPSSRSSTECTCAEDGGGWMGRVCELLGGCGGAGAYGMAPWRRGACLLRVLAHCGLAAQHRAPLARLVARLGQRRRGLGELRAALPRLRHRRLELLPHARPLLPPVRRRGFRLVPRSADGLALLGRLLGRVFSRRRRCRRRRLHARRRHLRHLRLRRRPRFLRLPPRRRRLLLPLPKAPPQQQL